MDHVGHAHFLIRLAFATLLVGWGGLLGCSDESPGCRILTARNGQQTLRCPGGGDVPLGSGETDEPFGTLRGTIRRFGYEWNEGIHVQMKGVHVALDTAPDGSWEVRDLPVGWYGAEISYPGYQPVSLPSLAVLPGIVDLDPIELKIGTRLVEGDKWTLKPSPLGRGTLAFESEGRLLWIDPTRADPLWLGNAVRAPTFTQDGERVVYLDEVTGRRVLKIFDTGSRARTTVAENVLDWEVGQPGAEIVAYVREFAEGQRLLEVWNHVAQTRSPVALDVWDWAVGRGGKVVLARVGNIAGGALVIWDVASETGTPLPGVPGELPDVGPDGLSFLFQDSTERILLWHGARNEVLPIEPPPTFFSFNGDGSQLLTAHSDGTLKRWNLRRGDTEEVVATDVTWATWSADGETLAFARWLADGRQQIRIREPDTGATFRVAETDRVMELEFSPDGSALFFVSRFADGTRRLFSFTAADGVEEIGPSARLPLFAPDGAGYVFTAGNSLWYRDLDHGSAAVELITDVQVGGGWPVGWWGDRLWVTASANWVGAFRVFSRSTGLLEWEAAGVHPGSIQGTEGGLFFLDDCNAPSDRGRLMRWRGGEAVEIHTGVRLDDRSTPLSSALEATFTPTGGKGFFQSDHWPERDPRILALFDEARQAPVPIDSLVVDAAVGESWLIWVVNDQRKGSASRSGVYVAHLPLPNSPQDVP